MFADADLTVDGFLGGRLSLAQPRRGYRAGIDPVLLAAAVSARAGQSVLELGCGGGTALLCLGRRVPGLLLTGVERQPAYAALAARNAAANAIAAEIVTAGVASLPAALRQRQFDHVIANPPWFDRATGPAAANPGREAGLGATTPLADWVAIAARRLAPRGRFALIAPAAALPVLLAASLSDAACLGALDVQPLASRAGRDARLILLRAVKGARAPFRLRAALTLHDGAARGADGKDYAPAIRAVLHDAAPFPFTAEITDAL